MLSSHGAALERDNQQDPAPGLEGAQDMAVCSVPALLVSSWRQYGLGLGFSVSALSVDD